MTKPYEWIVGPELKGKRLDQILVQRFSETSRTVLANMVKCGDILVNGESVKPGLKLKGGEQVRMIFRDPVPVQQLAATELNFPILFEDEHLIVINKPAGVTVHPGAGKERESVVSALLSHTGLSPVGAPLRPGVVHRLDKGTTGLMILAKTEKAHKKLAKSFAGRSVKKEYMALLQGAVKEEKGIIEVAVERDRVQRKRMKATSSDKGRMAKSKFQVVERLPGASLVQVVIETGRTHQIRVHMSFIGHPLFGDVMYGGSKLFGKPQHFLHSCRLKFTHPVTEKSMDFSCPLPEGFEQALAQLREGAKKSPPKKEGKNLA